MSLFKNPRLLIFLLLVTAFCRPVFSAEVSNRVVAVVNNEIITLHELHGKIKDLTGVDANGLKERDKQEYMNTGRRILDHLINEKLAQDKVNELGINVSPAQLDQAIDTVARNKAVTREELIAQIKEQGKSYEWYRELIKSQLQRMRLINQEVKSKIIIREEKIKDFYEKHMDDYRLEEKIHLAGIFLMQKSPGDRKEARRLKTKADRIVSRLRGGEDFATMAREFSSGPGADEGGDLGLFKISSLDPDIAGVVGAMSVGDISDPVINDSGIRIFKLVEKQEKKLRDLEEVRDGIYRKLYIEEIDKRYIAWVEELREKSYIKIYF